MPTRRLLGTPRPTSTRCPNCGAATRHAFQKNGYDLARCTRCRLEFVDPIPDDETLRAQYDDEAWFDWTSVSRSDADIESLRSSDKALPASQRRAYDEILAEAEARLGGKGSLLDIGCGNGPLLLRARDRGWDPHGLETSEWAVGFDREVLGLDVRRGVLEDHPYDGERFDLVTMIHSLEHMPRPVESLKAVHSLLTDRGIVRVEVPNHSSLGRRIHRRNWRAYVPPSHLWYFARNSLVDTLRAGGFETLAVDNRGFAPGIWKTSPTAGGHDDVDAPQPGDGAGTGAGSPKQMVKKYMRAPLQRLWLLDNLGAWARRLPRA